MIGPFKTSRKSFFFSTFLLIALTFLWVSVAQAQDRIALVIGNSNYGSVSPLDNPTRDAQLIAGTLQDIDFEVTLLIDATQKDMHSRPVAVRAQPSRKGPRNHGPVLLCRSRCAELWQQLPVAGGCILARCCGP